jgi:carboxyl-terminal processing protease
MDRALKVIIGVLAAIALVAVGFGAGYAAGGFGPTWSSAIKGSMVQEKLKKGGSTDTSLTPEQSQKELDELLGEIHTLIGEKALKPSTEASITRSTIDGMLKSLDDKYATYFDPKHFKFFNEQSMGSFGGIGVNLGENKKGEAYVVGVIKGGTPAEKAGVKKGDVFYDINGVKRDKWTTEEVMSKVRGPEGTQVKIGFKREGAKAPVYFTITRAQIKVPNIESELIKPDIGYIRLFSFNARSADEIAKAAADLKKQGAKGYILDLRDNPGGLLQAGVDVVSLFVKDGVVVRVDERNRDEQIYAVTPGRYVSDAPLVVLVNENSASASEIAAGAFQDYGRAILVGTKSFGKGSVQTILPLSNGGAVKFTTAHYLTPKRRVINGKGVTPEVVVKMDPKLEMDKKKDVQYLKAIEVLKKELAK